jgi:hypothetical protein
MAGGLRKTDESMLAECDELATDLVAYAREAMEATEPWPARVRAALRGVLDRLAEEPDLARVALLELPRGAAPARQCYHTTVASLISLMERDAPNARFSELPAGVGTMAVGGAESIIREQIAADRIDRLPTLLPELLFAVLVPYLGPDEAAEHMRDATS